MEDITEGTQALELRVDLLEKLDQDFIRDQIACLRNSTSLPIIYTLRSKGQGGRFDGSEQEYLDILRLGRRLGCEFLDVEACWNEYLTASLLENAGISWIISSLHNYKENVTESGVRSAILQCYKKGLVDVVKVVGFANSTEDNLVLQNTVAGLHNIQVPIIAICAGERGKISRVLNRFMTPVTHPLLPFKAAPGQLSIEEIWSLRESLSTVSTTNYYLFGSPISHSRSPHIHNTGFVNYSLHCKYSLFETTDVEKVVETLKKSDTGGGSVTIPLKQAILKYLDEVSPSATKIGAVNTIYKENGKLLGTNTDWFAIHKLVKEKLGSFDGSNPQKLKGLIIGAGGTARAACYALSELGIPFVIFNRSHEPAKQLTDHFGGGICTNLEDLTSVDVVIGTVPPTAQFQLPNHLLRKEMLIVELVYFPRHTPLLQQAIHHNIPYVEGIEILFEQGIAQFEIWTEKEAPRNRIVKKFLQADPSLSSNRPAFRL